MYASRENKIYSHGHTHRFSHNWETKISIMCPFVLILLVNAFVPMRGRDEEKQRQRERWSARLMECKTKKKHRQWNERRKNTYSMGTFFFLFFYFVCFSVAVYFYSAWHIIAGCRIRHRLFAHIVEPWIRYLYIYIYDDDVCCLPVKWESYADLIPVCVLCFGLPCDGYQCGWSIHNTHDSTTPFNGHAKNADRHCKQCFSRGLVHPVTDCFERMEKRKKNITTDPRPWIGTASDYAGSRPTKVVSIRRTSDALTTHRMPMHEDNDKNRCLAGMDREYSLWCTARPSARHCLGRNLFWTRRASGRVFFIGVGPQVLWIVCTIAMCAVA